MPETWLSETSSEGARTAILLGPLDESVLQQESQVFELGLLWIAPSKTHASGNLPPKVIAINRDSPSEGLSAAIEELIRVDYDNLPAVKVSKRVEEEQAEAYTPILDLVVSSIDSTARARRTRAETGVLRQEQVFRNLAGYLVRRIPESWRRSAEGSLAVVVGAGPSLDVTLPMIKQGLPKPLIIATDSSLRALESEDIVPHFVVSIDPEKSLQSCGSLDHKPGIAILSTQSHSSWPKGWKEKARYLSGRVLTEDWLATKGIPKTSILATNNAGLTSLLLADFLGPTAILLVGMDLAGGGSGQDRYADSTGRSHMQTFANQYHQVPGNHSDTVPTPFLSDWSETSQLCGKIASGRHVVNLNDRGAQLEGASVIHPENFNELSQALSEALRPFEPDPSILEESRGISGPGLDQVLTILATRCDEAWKGLRPLIEKDDAAPQEKLRYLRELLSNSEIASLLGDYSFAVMPEIAPGKEPDSETLTRRLRELQRILWLLEDAMIEAEPSEAFLTRLLTDTFA